MIEGALLKLPFYLQSDVVEIARLLLGKVLVTNFDGHLTSGIIVETEAYAGVDDKASHAFGGRITKRNQVMYREGGVAYVYLCYGIHSLFNVVTNQSGIPHAVLVRGIVPIDGIERMLKRSRNLKNNPKIGIGPGKASKLLGIHYTHSGLQLTGDDKQDTGLMIWIEDRGELFSGTISTGPRIGVEYAGEDARLPYRFCLTKKKAP